VKRISCPIDRRRQGLLSIFMLNGSPLDGYRRALQQTACGVTLLDCEFRGSSVARHIAHASPSPWPDPLSTFKAWGLASRSGFDWG
jgi:hypothetical protein